MDRHIIAIGGGGFGRNPGEGFIEQYILDQTIKRSLIFVSFQQLQEIMRLTKLIITQRFQN